MKVSVNPATEPPFKPFSITLTFEAQDEAVAFYAIMNLAMNTDFFASYGGNDKAIREAILDKISYSRQVVLWNELAAKMRGDEDEVLPQ